jgi:hypothetical protein
MMRPFSPYQQRRRAEQRWQGKTFEKAHGRLERRTLTATTALNEHLHWPGVGQVFQVVRERTVKGSTTREVAYGITSLSPQEANAERLLALNRGHWAIENRLFYVRDVTFGEDKCRVRTGNGPHMLAAVRNAAISLLRAVGITNIAAAVRQNAYQTNRLLTILGILKL